MTEDLASTAKIEIRKSRTGLPIPVVNNIHLHSEYDPVKEAQQLLEQYNSILQKTNKILVLGLGFAYHIEEIIKKLVAHHQIYQIYVIEPNQNLLAEYLQLRKIDDSNLKIICENEIARIYQNKDFLFFLTLRPEVIFHPASMNIYKSYFEKYLSYKASDSMEQFIEEIENEQIKKYLSTTVGSNHNINDFQSLIERIKEKKEKKAEDFFFLAFDQMN